MGDDWLALVRQYQQPLAGYLWAVGVARADLESLLVETFVAAYQHRPEQAGVRTSLYALATRLAQQHGVAHDRCLLVLCCLEGFTYADVADMCGLSAANVRRKVRRAKAALA